MVNVCRLHHIEQSMPKVCFPLPLINKLADLAPTRRLSNFLDALSGYNQLRMSLDNEIRNSFFTKGLNCYKVMSFGWKNAGATTNAYTTRYKLHIG